MTSRSTWKKLELKVAKMLGGQRNPLSGSASKHTSGDIIHDKFYVECKYRAKFAVVSLFKEVEEKAKAENKVPLLVLKQKNLRGELVVLRLEDFVKLVGGEK